MSGDSLIPRGGFLPGMELPDDVEARLDALEREQPGVCSGERIFRSRPDAYMAAVRLLARGHSIRDTAAIADISVPTVIAIRRREGMSVLAAAQKTDLSGVMADVARLGAETARERLAAGEGHDIPLDKLMLSSAIATDKAMVLAGEATQRIEHVVRDDDDDGWDAELERWRAAAVDAEVVDMGVTGARGVAKGDDGVAGASDGPASPSALPPADVVSAGDGAQSPANHGVHGVDTCVDTSDDVAGASRGRTGGGEGVSEVEGPCLQRYISDHRILSNGGSDDA